MTKGLPSEEVRDEEILWLVHYGRLDWSRAEQMPNRKRKALIEKIQEWKRKENEQQQKGQGGQGRRPSAGSSGFATVKRGG